MGMHKLFNDDYSGEIGRAPSLNSIKDYLIGKDWGSAMELLEVLERKNPTGLQEWRKDKSTITLMRICEPYRNWSIYSQRLEALPFDNDVAALDSAIAGCK